jgi:hypothetical protein
MPSDLHNVVLDAKVVKPFEIVPMLPSNLLNIQTVADEIICTKSLNIYKVVSITHDLTDFRVGVKDSFHDVLVCKKITTLKKGNSVNGIRPAQFDAVPSERSITNEKKRDLRAKFQHLTQGQHRAFHMEMCGDNV